MASRIEDTIYPTRIESILSRAKSLSVLRVTLTRPHTEFAAHLQQRLLDQNGSDPAPDLSIYYKALPLPRSEVPPSERTKLNNQGIALWNTCTKSKRCDQSRSHRECLSKGILVVLSSFRRTQLTTCSTRIRILSSRKRWSDRYNTL